MKSRIRNRARRRSGMPLWKLCMSRVLHKLCPQCGQGLLFSGFLTLRERCGVCGLIYRREPGAGLGSMYLGTTVTQTMGAVLVLAIFFGTDWSPALATAIGVPFMLAVCYGLQPYSMALWVAVEYLHDVGNHEWWARPRR
jgi:uncharacterized protein (DUF983 family)